MKLYNQLTRNIEEFIPQEEGKVKIYSCGPTVYDHAHIGNLSAFIFADLLRRSFEIQGYKVTHAMNYTDVDDKTIRRSQEENTDGSDPYKALRKVTDKYIDIFLDDMKALGNDISALTFLRATDYIEQMKSLIQELVKRGFAYLAEDGIYFSIESYRKSGKTYGQLLTLTSENTSEARIQNDEYDKDSVHDFALWKKHKDNEPSWEFTIDGQKFDGRPGWHIECSVMSQEALGQPFDIHTGGIDLIFPHHENEIAQSTALTNNVTMSQFFTHNNHILVNDAKMSKSKKNFMTLEDIVSEGHDPIAFRYLILQSQYNNQGNFSLVNLESAAAALQNLKNDLSWIYQMRISKEESGAELSAYFEPAKEEIKAALANNLDTPKALATLHHYVSDFVTWPGDKVHIGAVEEFARFVEQALGITILDASKPSDEVMEVIQARNDARAKKNYQLADEHRRKLESLGFGVRDTGSQTLWYTVQKSKK